MISYYITWHMHARLAPVLFTDDDKAAAQAARHSPVAPAARSPRALAKAAAKRTPDDLPVHSFDSLLADLAIICLNQIQPADPALPGFRLVTTPTPLQRQASPRPARRQPPARGRVVSSPPRTTPKSQVNGHARACNLRCVKIFFAWLAVSFT